MAEPTRESEVQYQTDTTRYVESEVGVGWMSRIQWGAVLAGALAGFAATLIMSALGLAIGATAAASADLATRPDPEDVATPFGAGGVIWILLTAIVSGLIGGFVMKRSTRPEAAYMPNTFAVLTWSAGILGMLVLGAMGAGSLMGGMGAGAAGAAAIAMEDGDELRAGERPAADQPDRARPDSEQPRATPEQRREQTEKAADVAAVTSWVLLGSLLVGLISTVIAANVRARNREDQVPEPVT